MQYQIIIDVGFENGADTASLPGRVAAACASVIKNIDDVALVSVTELQTAAEQSINPEGG